MLQEEFTYNPLARALGAFLESYPTTLHSSLPSSWYELMVFWSHDDPEPIPDKIRCAFQNLHVFVFSKGLIQFWAPPKSASGRQLLTTADQPFILATLHGDEDKYRLCSLKYQYCVDNPNPGGVEEDEDVRIIRDGAAGRAFLNQTPELLFLDLKVAAGSPLVSSALESGLRCCVMFPVFDPSQSSCCCVGVVECSTRLPYELIGVFNKLNTALEKEGLKTFHVRDRLPYKTMRGWKHVKNEIDEALKIISHTHGLDLAHFI
ncbi:hypothetical protein L6452_25341 [Arctium lappa]|uniref:Uncharacterized protein n=1 Tax=Arctium lappa TaxID=4217 RepID=A0ACB9AB91_ARCLA|nr:hypothetical protein L6452_25341 [Arctium lappa]